MRARLKPKVRMCIGVCNPKRKATSGGYYCNNCRQRKRQISQELGHLPTFGDETRATDTSGPNIGE